MKKVWLLLLLVGRGVYKVVQFLRATSLVCLLGLGLGLGSLLLYKLCRSIFGRSPSPNNQTLTSRCHGDIQTPSPRHPSPHHVASCQKRRALSQSSLDRPSPDTPSDSGISSMGNYQSDTSAAVSPDSGYPAAIYNTAGGVRFRGFRRDDKVLEEECDPLVNGSPSGQSRSEEDDESDEAGTGDDETRGLLTGRRKPKRSPSTIRRQLTIDIPLDDGCTIRYHRTLSSASSDLDGSHLDSGMRDISFDGESIGGFSLMPNFSPTSLHEKNLRLIDDETETSDSTLLLKNGENDLEEEAVEPSTSKSESSKTSVPCTTELTSCTTHPLQTPNSPVSTNESSSSQIVDGSGSTQSEYLSSEPRSRSLSPEIMNIFAKYRSTLDNQGATSPGSVSQNIISSHQPEGNSLKELADESPSRKHRNLRHSHSSLSSLSSSADMSSKVMTLRAHSLDLTENPSGLGSPDSEFFNPGDVGLKTAASMEHIQNELRNLEQEIAEINTTFQVLNSRENLTLDADPGSGSKDSSVSSFLRVLQRHKVREESTMTRSLSMFDEREELEESEQDKKKWRHSYHHAGQFIWDYQSDIGSTITPPTRRRFVDHWITLDDSGENSREHSGAQSPSFEHVRSYLRQSADSSTGSDVPHNSSLADLYIDDDLSGLANSDTQQLRLQGQSDASSLNSGEQTFSSNSDHEIQFSPMKSLKDNPRNERDQTDGDSTPQGSERRMVSVGPRADVVEYAEHEWRGQTERASTMRNGYGEIRQKLGFHYLRRIRGDNYCALRATLFQILTAGIKLPQASGQLDRLKERLEIFRDSDHKFLQHDWTFGGRLCRGEASVYEMANRCVSTLLTKMESVVTHEKLEERESAAEALLNSEEETDLLLMEGVKLLMLLGAIDLNRISLAGGDVPTFAMLMFARDTSSTLQSFVKNHLNTVGDSGGLEQIEMFLLGYVLGVIIKVIRPSQYGQSDFVTVFSEEPESSTLSTVTLIAEDDRHYNVLL